MNFDLSLSAVLAHTLLLESKGPEPMGEVWARNGGDNPPAKHEMPGVAMRAFVNQFPRMVGVTLPQVTPIQQSLLAAAQATEPGFNELQTSQYEQMAPRLAQAGANAEQIGRQSSAQTDAGILAGPGRQIVDQSLALDRTANPEFYNMREALARMMPELMSGQLTGGESEAIQRSLNQDNQRRGVINTPSQLNTVSNAMQFGDASRQRQMQGAAAATGFMGASRTGFDPLQAALGRPSGNMGQGQFLGVQRPGGEQAFGTANSLMNNTYSTANNWGTLRANARDTLDRVNETMSAQPISL